MKNKSVSFYLTLVAAVLLLVGLPFYAQSAYAISTVYIMTAVVVAVEIAIFLTKGEIANGLCIAGAVAAAAAVIFSFSTQLDAIGYVLSGLFTFSQIQGFVTFAILAIVGWILFLVASFTGVSKKN